MRLLRVEDMLTDPTPVPEPARFHGEAFSSDIGATETSRTSAALIRLAPGSRGHWHHHRDGQLIHVVDGHGFIGRRDAEPLRLRAGDMVWIEPGEEHWHGATEESHLAQVAMNFGPITWLEPSR
ncbi:MAG: cupin domain-containing protein [Kibdelosporangium sp.]